jgi:contractile injection system tube protein
MPLTPTARALMFKVSSSNPSAEPPAVGSPNSIVVQFNPTTLSYSVQNTLEKKGKDAKAKQFVAQSTAKLEFDLIFDSTHDGKDVRAETNKVKQFLNPGDKSSNKDQAPPVVGFRWGTFKFKGVMESFKEMLDFFSTDGVPLRSTIKLSLAAQEAKDIFTDEAFDGVAAGMADAANAQLAPMPPGGPSELASQGGDPSAGRAVAAANGMESMRNPGAMTAAIGGGVQLKAAAGFAPSGGAGIGLGGGIGGGISAGSGAGIGIAGGISAGGSASAGVSASMGAFAGLKASASATVAPRGLPSLNVPALSARVQAVPATAEFALGGKAVSTTSSGLRTDVGISARIRFD